MRLRRLLVANRGEIAVRVTRTCRRLGVRTVAVYSDADAHALHVAEADEAYRIGPPPAADSYLNVAALLDVARQTDADAVHPGYGFLSENPDFAQACLDAGLVWVGPSPEAMRAVGDKARAKRLAEEHGVPVLAGYHDADQTLVRLETEAERIGFPLLIKASAGGGGRGMRVVDGASAFSDALEAAQREARASFGDDRVLLERYVRRPRHVEVQVLGDQHGNLIHLGERECSIQRRHQKLIEETPSPAVSPAMREAMGDAALRLMRAAGYSNAGTVEFLLEPDGTFSFLEVNARLQVEHPVTEAVTGLDLVELQLLVAAGEPLPLRQADVQLNGHAIEVRVIAEDPLADFLPSAGRIEQLEVPSFVRTDSGVRDGAEVSPYYDSLLAKIVSHADDRRFALQKMAHALQEVRVVGVRNNVDLLLSVVEHPAFASGELHTGFLEEHGLLAALADVPAEALASAAVLDFLQPSREDDPWRGPGAWRLGRIGQPATWTRSGREHTVRVEQPAGRGEAEVRVGERTVAIRLLSSDEAAPRRVSIDGQSATVWDHESWRVVECGGRSYRFERTAPLSIDETARSHAGAGGAGRLSAPMPGRIAKVAVEVGQQVKANQPLVVLEAMKMEHVVEAPHPGVVSQVCVEVGEQVRGGTVLLELSDALEAPAPDTR